MIRFIDSSNDYNIFGRKSREFVSLVGYLSSHIQRAIVEWLLNIFTMVMKLTKVDWRNIESEKSMFAIQKSLKESVISCILSYSKT